RRPVPVDVRTCSRGESRVQARGHVAPVDEGDCSAAAGSFRIGGNQDVVDECLFRGVGAWKPDNQVTVRVTASGRPVAAGGYGVSPKLVRARPAILGR